jgi:hypothetical protein
VRAYASTTTRASTGAFKSVVSKRTPGRSAESPYADAAQIEVKPVDVARESWLSECVEESRSKTVIEERG